MYNRSAPRAAVIFKAYRHGILVAETWTSSPVTEATERLMYQGLLKKGHYTKVEVIIPDAATEVLLR